MDIVHIWHNDCIWCIDYNIDFLHRGYKTFFMLNPTEHEIITAHKTKILTNESDTFIMLINGKIPTIVGI